MPMHALHDEHLDHDLATIRIKNLRLRTYIGINEDEIQNRQDVVINVVIRYRAARAVQFNHISEAGRRREAQMSRKSDVEKLRYRESQVQKSEESGDMM